MCKPSLTPSATSMPPLTTSQFPQADRLDQVGRVAIAVSQGHTSDSAIEKFLGLHSEGRQGRYYRKAAEVVGLVRTRANTSTLTAAGQEFVALPAGDRRDFLAKCLTDTALFRAVTRYIAENKPNQTQLRDYIVGLYPGARNTAERRVNTVERFVLDSGLASVAGGRFVPGRLASGSLIDDIEAKQGLFGVPVPEDEQTGEPLVSTPPYTIEVDAAKQDRANLIHHRLVSGQAGFLRSKGFPAQSNELIDLFSRADNDTVLYEMKSLSNSNFVPQVRRAISQLYEYRYSFGVNDARLCVVTNGLPEKRSRWYLEYLQEDRGIAYVWTDDFSAFKCERPSAALLGRFSPAAA
jgi:hypothetical protein